MIIDLKHGEPIRFGADLERGVALNAFGECEIVNVADVGEDRLLVHDEHREHPSLAFAPLAARRLAADADADRRVPRRRPAGVRAGRAAPAGRRRRNARVPATSARSSSAPARPGPSSNDEPSAQSSSERNTRPVRGLGAKNVVFCGMRTPA